MKPEKALLQKPMDPAQATLANGVKCGAALIEWSAGYKGGEPGWSEIMLFTGMLLGHHPPGVMDVGFPGTVGTVKRWTGLQRHIRDAQGRTIIAVTTNKSLGQVAVLVDGGPDDGNPNAQECEVMVGAADRLLTQDLIDALQIWDAL